MMGIHQDTTKDPALVQESSEFPSPAPSPATDGMNELEHGAVQRRLKNYHVTMIGFCSGIGTGLFIGTGAAYAKAGPAGLLLAYIVVGVVLWCVMQSIAEIATFVRLTNNFSALGCVSLTGARYQLPDPSLTGPPGLLTHP